MKIIALILFLTATLVSAQNISRTEARGMTNILHIRINTNATAVNTRNAATESTNATQTAAIAAANTTNAAQALAIAAANDTNATQTAAITAAEVTNAAQFVALTGLTNLVAAKQHGSFTLSNLVAMGITNIIAGTNAVIYTNNGTLIIAGTVVDKTNGVPVIQVTNLLAQNIDVDLFNVGVLIATNSAFGGNTNFIVGVSNGSPTGPGTWNLNRTTNGAPVGVPAIIVNGTNGNVVISSLVVGPPGTAAILTNTLYASATLDFPSTAAGNTADLTITVTGASEGDIVAPGYGGNASGADWQFYSWVSSDNTVTVRMRVFAGTVNPVSDTFKMRVDKFQ